MRVNNQNNNSGNDPADLGCIILIGLIALPFILQSLLAAIIPYIMLGALGLGVYRLYVYDTRTRNITAWFEETFNLPQNDKKQLNDDTDDKINRLNSELKDLKEDNKTLRKENKDQIHSTIKQYSEHISKVKKKEVLNNIFGEQSTDNYARSDEFDRQQYQEETKKKKDELDTREFKQDVREQLFEQDQKIHEVSYEAQQDRYAIRQELQEGFKQVDAKFVYFGERFTKLEGEFANFKGYVAEKFSHLEVTFLKEITSVKEMVTTLRADVKTEFANTKLQFGKEILRIDKQQVSIIDRMQKYENQVKKFSIEMIQLKNTAERFAIRGEDLLNRANTIHQRHKVVLQQASNDLQLGLQQISLHKESFANTVGAAKLQIDETAKDMHFTLKDMAYERIGINMLRQEHDQRSELEREKMKNLIQEKRHLEQKIQMRLANGQQAAGLQHQLQMTQENLNYTAHRASLMQQEAGMVRKLTRN